MEIELYHLDKMNDIFGDLPKPQLTAPVLLRIQNATRARAMIVASTKLI